MMPLWGGIIALVVAVFITLSQWWGLVLAANPPPEEELFSSKMERLRAAQYALDVGDNGKVLTFEGEFTHGVTKRIANLIAENPQLETVTLTSPGGNIFEARGVAQQIFSAELDTHAAGDCSSACTLVFVAGRGRTAAPDARLGFHGYALLNAAQLPQFDVEAEQDRDRAFFVQQGVTDAFAKRMYDQPNPSIWFPTREELLEASVLRGRK
ncbi:hypothetical protein [Aliiroseovarius sp. 2305UL8-7]|uniref:COG3904 family protein n=1 Tax=Aliiroseovarius conchicola TaxID=3121637 RepID=UPI0035285F49